MYILISGHQQQGTYVWYVIVYCPQVQGSMKAIQTPLADGVGGHGVEPNRNGECRRWPFSVQAELGYYAPNRVFEGLIVRVPHAMLWPGQNCFAEFSICSRLSCPPA